MFVLYGMLSAFATLLTPWAVGVGVWAVFLARVVQVLLKCFQLNCRLMEKWPRELPNKKCVQQDHLPSAESEPLLARLLELVPLIAIKTVSAIHLKKCIKHCAKPSEYSVHFFASLAWKVSHMKLELVIILVLNWSLRYCQMHKCVPFGYEARNRAPIWDSLMTRTSGTSRFFVPLFEISRPNWTDCLRSSRHEKILKT